MGGGASGVAAEAESVASKPLEKWDVNEVCGLVKAMGLAEAADAIKEIGVGGKNSWQSVQDRPCVIRWDRCSSPTVLG